MSIVLEHVSKAYGETTVVRDVSIEIGDGELCVLLGPSGSGKSTVLRILAGLTDPDGGRVLLRGRDVTRVPPQARGVGFVFQHYALFQHMTVADNVEFALRVRGDRRGARRTRREELLEMVGLAGLGRRRPNQLSGGQQQRVALARALAHEPEVLLLDEPFGALDARIRVDLRRTVRAIQQALGVTTVFVTHDQEEAFELADRVVVLDRGRVLETGSPRELYLHPTAEFTATFLGSANLVIGERGAKGVRVGEVDLAVPAPPPHAGEPSRVQLLFRPEDVAVKDSADALRWPLLGKAVVESTSFLGPFERLRLRLPGLRGVRAISPPAPFGSDSIVVEAVRSQHQARRFPLRTGDDAWVGLRRVHALAHPGMAFLIVHDAAHASPAALSLGADLARRAKARVTLLGCALEDASSERTMHATAESLGPGLTSLETRAAAEPLDEALRAQSERVAHDLVVLGIGDGSSADVAAAALRHGDPHVLLVPPGAAAPRKILICSAPGEPGKRGVAFAGRLARHLDAAVAVLTVVPNDADETARSVAERYLAASARTLAAVGIRAATRLRTGGAADEILAEVGEGGYDLLVVGSPLPKPGSPPVLDGPVEQLVKTAGRSILIVRPTGAGA